MSTATRACRILVIGLVLSLVSGLGAPVPAAEESEAQAERDERFLAMVSGKRLEGNFSVAMPDGDSPPQTELYMVSEVTKGEGDTWVFTARMSYAGTEVSMPVPVDVLWAGETPVLTMTNQTIEGLGTFTARILLYDGRYAGTWQHGPVGGHMWGRLMAAPAAKVEHGSVPP